MSSSPNGSARKGNADINAVLYDDVRGGSPTTPARSRCLAYGSPDASTKIRKAKNHATPPTAGRERPPKRVSDVNDVDYPCRSVPDFDPIATAPKSTAVARRVGGDPSPVDVIAPPHADADAPIVRKGYARAQSVKSTKASTKTVAKKKAGTAAKSTKSSAKSTKAAAKQKSTVETNRAKCINNDIFTFARLARPILKTEESDSRVPMDIDEFQSWSDKQDELIRVRFKAIRISKKQREESIGLGRRSNSEPVQIVDDDAERLQTTNMKRLSRYHFEDILACRPGQEFVLYIRIHDDIIEEKFSGIPNQVKKEQKQLGIAGDTVSFGGAKYLVLKATVNNANMHLEAQSGRITVDQLEKLFDRGEGFSLKFHGSEEPIPFMWKEVISLAEDVLFFGPPLNGSRRYGRVFSSKSNYDYLRQTYRELARECIGDAFSAGQLAIAFKERMLRVITDKVKEHKTIEVLLTFNENDKSDQFFRVFDNLCKRRFAQVVVGWNDHNKSIIPPETFNDFVEYAPIAMPHLWAHMCNLRKIKGSYNAKDKKNEGKKRRMVLLQIFALRRMRDPKALKWWSLIQAVAYYGWGVGRTALDANNYWGMSCSSATRDRCLLQLTDKLVEKQTRFFSKEDAVTFVIDNYCVGQRLRDQRGGHSSSHLNGTNQMAHRVRPFEDIEHDDYYVDLIYSHDQDYVSTRYMREYEKRIFSSRAELFLKHKTMPEPKAPDKSGARVRSLTEYMKQSKWLGHFKRVFSGTGKADDVDPKDKFMPGKFDKKRIDETRKIVQSKNGQALLDAADEFHADSVRLWNPHADEVTESNYMGTVGIDEAASRECMALGLDLSLKGGVMQKNDSSDDAVDGSDEDEADKEFTTLMWKLVRDYESKRIALYGDVKTCDNVEKACNDMSDRPLSFKDLSRQADEFTKAMSQFILLPEDWHAGLTMLQSIFNVSWDGLLHPIKSKLKWSRLKQDVRDSYYQSSRLIKFIQEELVAILMQTFVSEKLDKFQDMFSRTQGDKSDGNFLCFLAREFSLWLDSLCDCDDDWMKCCAIFVKMLQDFFNFVASYRCGDAIGVEVGYQTFVTVWRVLGHHRYLERHWRQQEQLFAKIPFSVLEEIRRNRFVTKYKGKTGKGKLAMDEALELANQFFAQFPKVRTLEAFARQGNYIGLAIMCKRMVLAINTMRNFDEDHVYRSGLHPKAEAERTLLYEMFAQIGTTGVQSGRTFTKKMLWDAKPTTDLTNSKLERNMKEYTNDEAFRLLSSVAQIFDEIVRPVSADSNDDDDDGPPSPNQNTANISAEAEAELKRTEDTRLSQTLDDDGNRMTMPIVEETTQDEEDDKPEKKDDDVSKKLGYNKYLINNPWSAGAKKLKEDNVKKGRMEALRRRVRKRRLHRSLIEHVANQEESDELYCEKEEMDGEVPPWMDYGIAKYSHFYDSDSDCSK